MACPLTRAASPGSKSALARYTPNDFLDLVKKHNIQFYEKTLGQLFCRESARQIVEMLLVECEKAKVEIRVNCEVKEVAKDKYFKVETAQGAFESESLVVATGGLSFPKIGATDLDFILSLPFKVETVWIENQRDTSGD